MKKFLAVLLFAASFSTNVHATEVSSSAIINGGGSSSAALYVVPALVFLYFYATICSHERYINPMGWFAQNCAAGLLPKPTPRKSAEVEVLPALFASSGDYTN